MRLHVDAEKAAAQKLRLGGGTACNALFVVRPWHERAARACRADDEVKESGTRADIKQLFVLAWKHRSHQFARYAHTSV
jgi:hypothetical protein